MKHTNLYGLITIAFLLLQINLYTQNSIGCNFDEHRRHLESINIDLKEKREKSDMHCSGYRLLKNDRSRYTIPIVFHIIHNNGVENITDNQIIQSLSLLNSAFSNAPPYASNGGVDIEVEFCLANQDPGGNPTNGINRIQSPLTEFDKDFQDTDLKNLIFWDTKSYINVWVVREINSTSAGNNVAGYANFPNTHGSKYDGIVIESGLLGMNKSSGIVLVHEMGHYFGLYHTFEGGCSNSDCTLSGDKVCDTPPDQTNTPVLCNTTVNSCNTDIISGFASDENDHINNYMDYGNPSCMDQFTLGQKTRMFYYLENDRKSLINSIGCQQPCTNAVSIDIDFSTLSPELNQIVSIENKTNANEYKWFVNGQIYSTIPKPDFIFTVSGQYEIILQATGMTSNCFAFDTFYIVAQCSAVADFIPKIYDCIENYTGQIFTYTGSVTTPIIWYLNGDSLSNNTSIVPNFNKGSNTLELVAKNQFCEKRFEQIISISCTEDCKNKIDDDGDGLIDCYDDDCCEKCDHYYYNPCISDEKCNGFIPFSIKKKWESDRNVFTGVSPAVGDLDNNNAVEIIDFSQSVMIFDGQTGINKSSFAFANVNFRSAPSIADVDNDGRGEIIFIGRDNSVLCYEDNATLKFSTPNVVEPCCTTYLSARSDIADLNYDGKPEIIVGNKILNGQNGNILINGGVSTSVGFMALSNLKSYGNIAIANILPDDDPNYPKGLEIITGNQILTADLVSNTLNVAVSNSFLQDNFAVATDFDSDGDLDVLTALNNEVILWEGENTQILNRIMLTNTIVSIPTICNLDDDPELEFVLTTDNNFFINPGRIYAIDNDFSVLWSLEIGEHSQSSPISFDFNFDGKCEIIQRTDEFLNIFKGDNGDVLFKYPCISGTSNEHPIIADIDSDEHAELIVGCGLNVDLAYDGKLFAFEGDTQEWPNTRKVWNQPSFSNTQVEDDLSIPSEPQNIGNKNLRYGVKGFNTAIAISDDFFYDLEMANLKQKVICNPDFQMQVEFDVINKSNKSLIYDHSYTLYDMEPSQVGAQKIKTYRRVNTDTIKKFDTLRVIINLSDQDINPSKPGTYCLVINDLGTQALPLDASLDDVDFTNRECSFLNNKICFEYVPDNNPKPPLVDDQYILCPGKSLTLKIEEKWKDITWYDGSSLDSITISGSGKYWVKAKNNICSIHTDSFEIIDYINSTPLDLPDTLVQCNDNVIIIEATRGFKTYRWIDGHVDPTFTAYTPGIYSLEVQDDCGNKFTDSSVVVKNLLKINFPDTLKFCKGESDTLLTDIKFKKIEMFPDGNTYCNECNSVLVKAQKTGWIYFVAYDETNCISTDSLFLEINEAISYNVEIKNPCHNDNNGSIKLLFNDPDIDAYTFKWSNDSINNTVSNILPGAYAVTITNNNGCFQTDTFKLKSLDSINISVAIIKPCSGKSNGAIDVTTNDLTNTKFKWSNGKETNKIAGLSSGNFQLTITDANGCKENLTYVLEEREHAEVNLIDTIYKCVTDSVLIDTQWIYHADEIEILSKNCDTLIKKVIIDHQSFFEVNSNASCVGSNTGSLLLFSPGNEDFFYYWEKDSIQGTALNQLQAGKYDLTILDKNNCVNQYTFEIEEIGVNGFDIDSIYHIQANTDYPFIVSNASEISEIKWFPNIGLSCNNCFNPTINLANDQDYEIEILDINGCTVRLSTSFRLVKGKMVFPNIISYNSVSNNKFKLLSETPFFYDLTVFDRWGNKVFNGLNLDSGNEDAYWDGTMNGNKLSAGVYVYFLKVKDTEGKSYVGNITIID